MPSASDQVGASQRVLCRRRKAATIGGVAVGAIAVSIAGGMVAVGASVGPSTSAEPVPAAAPHEFPRNESGQTYGSEEDATSYDNAPDLIRAYTTDLKIGYVLRNDLRGPVPSTPDEAIALNSASAREIPVYAVDGKTRIGVFVVHAAGPISPGTH
jgi:hypothetical protein